MDKFDNQVTFILPVFFKYDSKQYYIWKSFCLEAENAYKELLESGVTAEEARTVLPNSTKTEIVVTMNIREWRHFLNLRACNSTGKANPQIMELAVPLLKDFYSYLPDLFEDLYNKLN